MLSDQSPLSAERSTKIGSRMANRLVPRQAEMRSKRRVGLKPTGGLEAGQRGLNEKEWEKNRISMLVISHRIP